MIDPSPQEMKAMLDYLKSHFRYGGAYANIIKVHHVLPFDERYYQAVGDSALMHQVFDALGESEFCDSYPHLGLYPAGRSGGYLQLHARKKHHTGMKSSCQDCHQQSVRNVIEIGNIGLEAGHPAWPMVNEMIKLTGMSGGNPIYKSDYFAQWARNKAGVNLSYYALLGLAELLSPLIVGKGTVFKCARCGSPNMVNFKSEPSHWVSAGVIDDCEDDLLAMETDALIRRYNLVKAFDAATQALIAEFKYLAENRALAKDVDAAVLPGSKLTTRSKVLS
jgi:hypothetical protein